MDFLALTNSAINFTLYCTMSRQFRTEFRKLLGIKVANNWIPFTQYFNDNDYTEVQVNNNLYIKMSNFCGAKQ